MFVKRLFQQKLCSSQSFNIYFYVINLSLTVLNVVTSTFDAVNTENI